MATQFKDYRKTKEVTLPVSGATVEVYDGLMTDDIEAIQAQGEKINIKDSIRRLIASWDFVSVDDKGEETPTPVNNENIGILHMKDFNAISNAVKMDDFLEESETPSPTGS